MSRHMYQVGCILQIPSMPTYVLVYSEYETVAHGVKFLGMLVVALRKNHSQVCSG
jgi:hypothetical protein